MRTRLVLAGALALFPAAASAAKDRVALRGEDCRDAPATMLDMIDTKWQHWRRWEHIIQLCPLFAPNGRLALSVLALHYDLFDAAGVPGSELDPKVPIDPPPDATILSLQGRILGNLPEGFPNNGFPSKVRVVFTGWHGGMPHRVETHVTDNAVFGTYDAPPLVWSDATQQYEMLISFYDKDCYDPPAPMLATLDAKWPGWRQRDTALQACPIFPPHGEFVLDVLIPRRELPTGARGARFNPSRAHPAAPESTLYILDPRYRGLGEAPVGPSGKGSVGAVRVFFTNWRNNFPNRVEVHAISGGVSRIYGSPLGWNAATHGFESVPP